MILEYEIKLYLREKQRKVLKQYIVDAQDSFLGHPMNSYNNKSPVSIDLQTIRMAKKLFVAATGQHKGKTTCTLGIAAVLKAHGFNVGYCKPVGQNHILIGDQTVDKDVVLFEGILDFDTQPDIHSPVIIASGVTSEFINDPSKFLFKERILEAAAYLENEYDVVVYEGTGHAGVGSIVGLSNAQVAKMLDAEVIVVAEGGIGSTFDRFSKQ